MPRYIERESLLEQMDDTCKYAKPTNDYQRGCNEVFDWCAKIIKNMPTVAVVPKIEYDNLKMQFEALDRECDRLEKAESEKHDKFIEAKAEVAREIFEEIEEALFNNHDLDIHSDYPTPHYYEELKDDIAELKKKYTEGKMW